MFEQLAIAINTGTNVPSVATPNGRAAFLLLLTSAVAPLIRLSYGRMVLLGTALPVNDDHCRSAGSHLCALNDLSREQELNA